MRTPRFEIPDPAPFDEEAFLARAYQEGDEDPTSLAYWFPRLHAAGVPVPKTEIVHMPPDAFKAVWDAFDAGTPASSPALRAFAGTLGAVVQDRFAGRYPVFLRTSHTSGKHEWKKTCFVQDPEDFLEHVFRIAYFSECVSAGPWKTWAVREFLDTKRYGSCPGYGDFPVAREFRFFVAGPKVECFHPYWPPGALETGGYNGAPHQHDALLKDPPKEVFSLAEAAGAALPGYRWSVDVLETQDRGWVVTDAALRETSWHWEGCDA